MYSWGVYVEKILNFDLFIMSIRKCMTFERKEKENVYCHNIKCNNNKKNYNVTKSRIEQAKKESVLA